MSSYSLTQSLLASQADDHRRATQSDFLRLAARGEASKDVLGKWLANDRLYIHSYIRGVGHLLSFLEYPETAHHPGDGEGEGEGQTPTPPAVRLLDWLVAALVNIRREEKFFVRTAADYGIPINLATQADGDAHRKVAEADKLQGLVWFEALFDSVLPGDGELPWLEAAVLFWGTEKCYLDAWSWAKAQLAPRADPSQDADGGAVREHFIDNWTSPEFVAFVDDLGRIIDEAVAELVASKGEPMKAELFARAETMWREVLVAEEAFWPKL